RIILLAIVSLQAASYKILVYNPKFGYSHSNFLGNIADILVDAGHDVTSFIPILDPEAKDGTVKSKKVYVPQSEKSKKLIHSVKVEKADYFSWSNFDLIRTLQMPRTFDRQLILQCEAVLEDTEILQKFQDEKFDVMIVENFEMCGVAYSHLVRPKSLITTSASSPFSFMYEEFGIPL
ncbi:hypothetical protein PENTCL1PPCAC_8115, partial [Pristionchus entomophagus]